MADKAISSRSSRRGDPGSMMLKHARAYVRTDNLVVLGVFVLILALVFALQFLPSGMGIEAASPRAAVAGEGKMPVTGEFRGISLQLHNSDPNIPFEQYIDEIAATGANTVSLVVAGYQENCSSTSIFIDARKTPPAARIRRLVARAHDKGLRVVLMPVVLLENARTGEWRGKIAPGDEAKWDAWWEDYVNYIMHYTYIAQEAKVDLLMVGSELVSTESRIENWRALITKVRKAYKGRISYSANWDHFKPVKWWADLDAIGMTTYHDLTGGKKPTVERLMAAWKPIKRDILTWRAKINLPIIFTEVGWPNQDTCAQYPWNYYSSETTDPRAQANCFEAFFRTWADEPSVAGILVWEWRNYPAQKTAPDKDTSYALTDKPAMEIVRKYFRLRARQEQAKASTQPAATSCPALADR